MARRVSRAALSAAVGVLALLLDGGAGTSAGAIAEAPPVLLRLGFDDGNPVTGPDTLAVFEHARGRVRLSREIVFSGRRAASRATPRGGSRALSPARRTARRAASRSWARFAG